MKPGVFDLQIDQSDGDKLYRYEDEEAIYSIFPSKARIYYGQRGPRPGITFRGEIDAKKISDLQFEATQGTRYRLTISPDEKKVKVEAL